MRHGALLNRISTYTDNERARLLKQILFNTQIPKRFATNLNITLNIINNITSTCAVVFYQTYVGWCRKNVATKQVRRTMSGKDGREREREKAKRDIRKREEILGC